MSRTKEQEPLKTQTEMQSEKKMRKGLTLIETLLVVVLLFAVLAVVFSMFPKIKGKLDVMGLNSSATMVIGGVESAKSQYGNGRYIASSKKAIPDIKALKLSLGGEKATESLSDWTYECPDGASSTITVTTPDIQNDDARDGLEMSFNSKNSDWVATVNGDTVEFTLDKVLCK